MNTRTRKIVYTSTGIVIIVVGVVVTQQGFAWTNPASNPPLGTNTINISGSKVGIGTTNPFGVFESFTNLDIPAVRGNSTGASGVGVNGESTASGAGAGVSAKGWRGVYAESTDLVNGWAGYFLGRGYFSGNVGVGTATLDTNYRITTSGGGVKAGNSSATQPAGYFSNAGGGPAITVGTGGITLGGVNQTAWPVSASQWTTSGDDIYKANIGNVGIGKTNPQNALHIFTTLPAGGLDIDGTASNSIVRFKNNGTSKAFVGIANSAGAIINGSTANDTAIRFDGGNLLFGYGATEVARITSGGDMGIGTTAPEAKLHVAGNIVVNGVNIGTGSGNISSNTAVGLYSLFANSGGYSNSAFGSSALFSNTSGMYNTALGGGALYSNTTGGYNTAVGPDTLRFNTTGTYNTGVGLEVLTSNTIGTDNTAIGSRTLLLNTSGNLNTAVGSRALYANTGSWNTAVGGYALDSNTTGNYNVASGYNALTANTLGSLNTAVGPGALQSSMTGLSNTAIGQNSNSSNTTGSYNVSLGASSLMSNSTGSNNTAVGYLANVASGALTNATAIGYNAIVNASNKVRIGGTAVTVIEGQVGWSIGSDIRLKHDVVDSDLGLGFINKLRPVSYKLNNGDGGLNYGFIAQEVEAAVGKKTNIVMTDNTPEMMKTMRYTDLIAPMVKAIQEQQLQIKEQKERIEKLEALIK